MRWCLPAATVNVGCHTRCPLPVRRDRSECVRLRCAFQTHIRTTSRTRCCVCWHAIALTSSSVGVHRCCHRPTPTRSPERTRRSESNATQLHAHGVARDTTPRMAHTPAVCWHTSVPLPSVCSAQEQSHESGCAHSFVRSQMTTDCVCKCMQSVA